MSELKPCPFCGSQVTDFILDGGYSRGWKYGYMKCLTCDAQGPLSYSPVDEKNAKDAAISGWNDRTTSDQEAGE